MAERRPIAFLSYVRSDDDHDEGRITSFRKHLEGEIKMQTGKTFAIFQDRNDIAWGQNWEERINTSLSDVTFLIPILTPSFFESPACRSEFQTFSIKEKTLGVNRLILPVYYVECDQLADGYPRNKDDIVDILRQRNWTDWRPFRFKKFSDEPVAEALAKMAAMVKASIKELNSISVITASKIGAISLGAIDTKGRLALPKIVPEDIILSSEKSQPKLSPEEISEPYEIPEVSAFAHDKFRWAEVTQRHPYYVYTRKFDEVVDASSMAEQAELIKLFAYVSAFCEALKKIFEPIVAEKIARFRRAPDAPGIAVTILVDNSGSMRGHKIVHAASWSLLLSEWLERLRIPNEVLGFTTRAWKGGQSHEEWLKDGKPPRPGRLNDIRHIVYKSFSLSTAAAAPNFGVMAREGLLKENIDGEAVLWASSRLQNHEAPNKVLFVVGDGAPVDDSTLSVNPGDFLTSHLKSVIASLSGAVKIYAVGIEYDVSHYYPNAVVAEDAGHLGIQVFSTLVKDPAFSKAFVSAPEFDLSPPKAPRRRRKRS